MPIDKKISKKAVIKMLVIALFLILNISLLKELVTGFRDDLAWNDAQSNISLYDKYIKDGNYNGLRDTLLLFDAHDEMFDSYWEIADSYLYLSDYKVWRKASQELAGNKEAYELLMAENKDKLLTVSKNSTFERNRMIVESFVKQTGKTPAAEPAFQFVKGHGIVSSESPVYLLDVVVPSTLTKGDVTVSLVDATQQGQKLIANFTILDRSKIITSERYREDIWRAGEGLTLRGTDIPDGGCKPGESQYISDSDFYEQYGYMRYFIAASFELSSVPDDRKEPSGYAIQILDFESAMEFSLKQAPGYETLEALAVGEGSMETYDGTSILAVGEVVEEGILVDWYQYSESGDRSVSVTYTPPMQKGSVPILSLGEKQYPSEQNYLYSEMPGIYRLKGISTGGQHIRQLFVVPREEREAQFSLTVPGITFLMSEESAPITLRIPEDSEELTVEIPFGEGKVRLLKITKMTGQQEERYEDSSGSITAMERPAVYVDVSAVSDTKDISLKRLICQRKVGAVKGEGGWENQRYDYDSNHNLSGFRVFYEEGDTEITLKFSLPGFYWNQPFELELRPSTAALGNKG